MPTPFSHLRITQRLMRDPLVPESVREFAFAHHADFLLGGIVADQRPIGGKRHDTHFYEYSKPMPDNPWREMFRRYPALKDPVSDSHKAFLTAYVAHLASDEYWTRYMLKPHFADSDWGDDLFGRFYMLHFMLISMDERDEALLEDTPHQIIPHCVPDQWLPFLPDDRICNWRDFIATQLRDNESQTLKIFGGRINTPPEEVREKLDDIEYMQTQLWDHVSRDTLAEIEAKLYEFSREQMLIYLDEFFKT